MPKESTSQVGEDHVLNWMKKHKSPMTVSVYRALAGTEEEGAENPLPPGLKDDSGSSPLRHLKADPAL